MKTIRLVFNALEDLIIRKLPQIKKKEGFAFLVHPRDTHDVKIKYPFLKIIPDKAIKFILRHYWPVTVSKIDGVITKDGKPIQGWVVTCPIMAEQMIEDRELAKKFIIKTAKLAERKGAKIMGLGALTASFTRGGIDIIDNIDCRITTGKLFTSKIVTDTTSKIVSELGLDKKKIRVSIVGAAGSIGSASAQILAKKGFNKIDLVDLSDKDTKVEKIIGYIKKLNPEIETRHIEDLNSIKESDIIITATNRLDALIKSEHLKSGAVVVDDAQPTDVDMDIVKNRKDVLILEGGAAHSDKINAHFNFGLKDRGDIFSCLAEVVLLTYSNLEVGYNIGEILEVDFDTLEKLEQLADQMGISVAKFQNMKKIYSNEDINFVKQIIQGQNK